MRRQTIAVLMLFTVCFLFANVGAQDFSKSTIRKNYEVLSANRRTGDFDKQIESILKYFSSLVGSGFVHTASLHQIAGLDIGARGVITVVPDELKDIVPGNLPDVKDPLSGANAVPIPFLHASLGLPANFEIMAKFTTTSFDQPDESVTLLGGALKYGLLRGNMALPAVTLLAGYQTLLVPDQYAFGNVSTVSLKGYISKGFGIATLYGGGGIDRTNLKLEIPGFPDLKGEYEVTYASGVVGATFSPLPLLKVNGEVNLGELKNITVGATISIR